MNPSFPGNPLSPGTPGSPFGPGGKSVIEITPGSPRSPFSPGKPFSPVKLIKLKSQIAVHNVILKKLANFTKCKVVFFSPKITFERNIVYFETFSQQNAVKHV